MHAMHVHDVPNFRVSAPWEASTPIAHVPVPVPSCVCTMYLRHADFERWVSSLARWIDPLRSPSPPPSPPPSLPPSLLQSLPPPTTRVQHGSTSRDWWCDPPSSVGGSVAAAAGTGAALYDSSQQDLAGAKATCGKTMRVRRGSVGKVPDLQTLGADLYVSGEVTQQQLSLPPAVLVISPENPGAANLAQEILKKYPDLRFEPPGMYNSRSRFGGLVGSQPANTVDGIAVRATEHAGRTLSERLPGHRVGSSRRHLDQRSRHFLLYLNQETWLGSVGSKLADQVRAACAAGIRVILAHENDPALGGCEFSSFFQTTPQDLIADGLYARIAVAFFTGQHRAVSMCLLAREIGAVRHNMIKACVGGALTRLADAMHTNQRGSAAEQGERGVVAAKDNAAWCDRQIAAEEERRSRSRRSGSSEMPADPEEEHATAEEPLVAPTPEAGQGRHSFSQASSSAGPRLSGGSREVSPHGMSPRFSGGPRFAGAPPAVVTPAGDETDGESGSDSQASASSQCPRAYCV